MAPGVSDMVKQMTQASRSPSMRMACLVSASLAGAMLFAASAQAAPPQPTPVSLTSKDAVPAVASGPAMLRRLSPDQYHAMAQSIAAQVVDPAHRGVLIACKPAAATMPDDRCASQFLAEVGELLYRRPLSKDEVQLQVSTARTAALQNKDFYAG